MKEREVPGTLDEAYVMRDASQTLEEWEFYQEHVYRLRAREYQRGNVNTEKSRQRRERNRAEEIPPPQGEREERERRANQHRRRWWRMFG